MNFDSTNLFENGRVIQINSLPDYKMEENGFNIVNNSKIINEKENTVNVFENASMNNNYL